MKKSKNAIHAFGDDGVASHIGTYYVNNQKDGQSVIQAMKEESKKVGRIIKAETSANAFLVQLHSDVVVDVFLSNYTDATGDKSTVYAVSQNSKYIPGQNAVDVARIMHAPIIKDRDATNKDAVVTHIPIANNEELEADNSNFSLRVKNEGRGVASIATFYDAHSNENQLQPEEIINEIGKLRLYCSPSYVFLLSVQHAYQQNAKQQQAEELER